MKVTKSHIVMWSVGAVLILVGLATYKQISSDPEISQAPAEYTEILKVPADLISGAIIMPPGVSLSVSPQKERNFSDIKNGWIIYKIIENKSLALYKYSAPGYGEEEFQYGYMKIPLDFLLAEKSIPRTVSYFAAKAAWDSDKGSFLITFQKQADIWYTISLGLMVPFGLFMIIWSFVPQRRGRKKEAIKKE